MDLSNGIPMVAIPGPSILPDRVRQAFAQPMPDIYAGDLLDVSDRVLHRLGGIARTRGHCFIMASNGHGAWQMAISNLLSPGDTVLVLESGRFAAAWGEYAALAGAKVETVPGDFRRPVDPTAVTDHLLADPNGRIRAILVAHTDTSSSVRNDIAAIRQAIDAAGHDALLLVDCIASMACEPFEMDAWGVDLAVAAAQKGLMCPPGLAFAWAGERAIEQFDRTKTQAPGRVGYFDWASRINPEIFYQTYAGTPPVAHLYALDAALDMIEEEGGLEAVWARHAALADAVRSAVEAWSHPSGISFNIVDAPYRSNAVTTVLAGDIDAERMRSICKSQANVVVGLGISVTAGASFRIGHMGYLNPPMILGTLGTIEAALRSMNAPLGGSGVDAAADSIGRSLRSA